MTKDKKRKLLKTMLGVSVIVTLCVGAYLTYVYYPLIRFKLKGSDLTKTSIEFKTELSEDLGISEDGLKDMPKENTLVIPKIGVKAEILEGETLNVLDKDEGVWREPYTSIPTRGSNMVIAGHRFQFLPPNNNTFYLLPELKEGDYIIIYWEGEEYKYKVSETLDSSVWTDFVYKKEKNTTVTLYTCTPLETAHRRFVVRAEIIN